MYVQKRLKMTGKAKKGVLNMDKDGYPVVLAVHTLPNQTGRDSTGHHSQRCYSLEPVAIAWRRFCLEETPAGAGVAAL